MSALMPTYARFDLAFERGDGAWLYADDGRRFLDFGSGIAVAGLGHAHPHLVAALRRQAEKLWHCSNLYRIPEQERLGQRLCAASFAERVFFGNSGAEAVEACLKLARKYHDETGNPDRWRVVVAENAFHGRTLATIAAGGQPKHVQGFEPAVEGFDRVPYGDAEAAAAAVGPETAAILVEPIQGEGGIVAPGEDYLRRLRAIADEHGILLIFDEVQTGMGRTGRLFAHEWAGVTPDVMAVAKGLGGGFPIGACLATARAAAGMTAGSHGSTFGGNPLASAVGNAVLDVILADGFLESVRRRAETLRARLAELAARHPKVLSGVRGKGLLLGLKCAAPNTGVVAKLQDNGLLAVPAGDNVVRLLPPLIVGEEEIDAAVEIIDRSCRELTG